MGLIIVVVLDFDFFPVSQYKGAFIVIPLSNDPSPKVENFTSVRVANAPISQPLLKFLAIEIEYHSCI